MITLKELLETQDYAFASSNFIDSFRRDYDPKKIEDSILELENINDVQKALMAATVDQLCNEVKMDRPDWVYDPSTFLKKPYFAMNAKGNLRLILLQESPRWFRSRNLFVSANCLERV